MKKYIIASIAFILLLVISLTLFFVMKPEKKIEFTQKHTQNMSSPSGAQEQEVMIKTPSQSYVIPSASYVSQTFNNCGPATLSMALSYFGQHITQDELREQMRPFNNPGGGNDDKSVFASEFVEYGHKYGMLGIARPNGTSELLKTFIANDIPVIVRTWLHPHEDIGHFRIVRGYDDTKGVFIQDDSYEGRNLEYTYSTFDEIWKPFNYGYIVIYPSEKQEVVEKIVGQDIDENVAYKNALERANTNLAASPNSVYDLFNASTAYYHLGNPQKSVEYYEKAQSQSLPPRMLWYQYEPLKAYLDIKDYERVFALTDWIITNNNIAFSEMYILRGKAYLAQGNKDAARAEFEKAVYYNKNLTIAKEALNSL